MDVDGGEECVGRRNRGYFADAESAWSEGGGVIGGDGETGKGGDDGGEAAGEEEITICSCSGALRRRLFAETSGGDKGSPW